MNGTTTPDQYQSARGKALCGESAAARADYERLLAGELDGALRARLLNDLGTIDILAGADARGVERFREALSLDDNCAAAQANLELIQQLAVPRMAEGDHNGKSAETPSTRIAIVSFLFNWPSTGGGIIHTVELAQFLTAAGYDVRLYCPQYAGWNIGRCGDGCPVPVEKIPFAESDWNLETIKERFRESINEFAPDHVLITDCWNMKPHIADALRRYSVLWRMQAQECLCPLNNLRLLTDTRGEIVQCDANQLSSPDHCLECLKSHNHQSGPLHRAERALAEVWTPEYRQLLQRTILEATAILVLNPTVAELYRPHIDNVQVVTWGMDAARFVEPSPQPTDCDGRIRILFAGVAAELIKGFRVLEEACHRLWQKRQDFELVVTIDPPGNVEPFTRYVGWQSQADLPGWYARCDITAVPTIAQDGLSRTSVEAMASARPVVASRIGGLPFTVEDEVTGLLCEPGDPADWADKLNCLLDDAELRKRLGSEGRQRFEERFPWERVIYEQYRPLLDEVSSRAAKVQRDKVKQHSTS